MNFQETIDFFKEQYSKHLTFTEENEGGLIFEKQGTFFKIEPDDIRGYSDFVVLKSTFGALPNICSIVSNNYREQIIDFTSQYQKRLYGPLSLRRIFTFGEKNPDTIYAEISPASAEFINYNRFGEDYIEFCNDRWSRRFYQEQGKDFIDMRETFYRPTTIKVFNLKQSTIDKSVEISNNVINSCLFALSSIRGIPMLIITEWESRDRNREKEFEFGEKLTGGNLPIKTLKFDNNLFHYYQMAVTSDMPSLKFLAFYQIIEYFFIQVADEELYNKLTRRINDIRFKTNSTHLDKLIQDVENHKRDTDETEMLKLVLKKYVDEDEIIEFIKEYEIFLGKGNEIYTKKRTIFGEEVAANTLQKNHVLGIISKTIKLIRNGLVHSSDRYQRNERYVPFSKEHNEMLKKDIPLIKFLAEKVMIATANN